MAENETVVVEEVPENQVTEPAPQKPSKVKKPQSGAKEWFRKKVVGLKRKPQNIALLLFAVSTIYFMLVLFKLSIAVSSAASNQYVKATGICIFIVTLLSLLVLVSFLNAFPKRKKVNIFFTIMVFVMTAGILACEVVTYLQMSECLIHLSSDTSDLYIAVDVARPYIVGHIVLMGLSTVLFALLPVYSKLIYKINTKVELESATENMQSAIDIQED